MSCLEQGVHVVNSKLTGSVETSTSTPRLAALSSLTPSKPTELNEWRNFGERLVFKPSV